MLRIKASRKCGNVKTMSIQRRGIVQIVNPVRGGSRYTSHKSALQFVRRGRAVWEADGSAIRFTAEVLAPQSGASGGAGEKAFRWRRGISGGMAQVLGSMALPPTGFTGCVKTAAGDGRTIP
jgi:hypothetical protein